MSFLNKIFKKEIIKKSTHPVAMAGNSLSFMTKVQEGVDKFTEELERQNNKEKNEKRN